MEKVNCIPEDWKGRCALFLLGEHVVKRFAPDQYWNGVLRGRMHEKLRRLEEAVQEQIDICAANGIERFVTEFQSFNGGDMIVGKALRDIKEKRDSVQYLVASRKTIVKFEWPGAQKVLEEADYLINSPIANNDSFHKAHAGFFSLVVCYMGPKRFIASEWVRAYRTADVQVVNLYEAANGIAKPVYIAPCLEEDAGYLKLVKEKRALSKQIHDSYRCTRSLIAQWNRAEKNLIRYVRDFSVEEGRRLAVAEANGQAAREP